METIFGFLGVIGALASIFGAWLAVNWVLGPLDRAAKNRFHPIQFTLADFLCLFVQIQLLLAVPAASFHGVDDRRPVIGITVGIIALVLLVWWTGVRTLSRAGVHDTRGRALTLVIGIPFGYSLSLSIPVVAFMMLEPLARPELRMGSRDGLPTGILFLAELAIIVSVWGLGIMTRRILRTAKPRPEMTPLQDLLQASQWDHPTSPTSPTRSET
jgi:hypothetical protein